MTLCRPPLPATALAHAVRSYVRHARRTSGRCQVHSLRRHAAPPPPPQNSVRQQEQLRCSGIIHQHDGASTVCPTRPLCSDAGGRVLIRHRSDRKRRCQEVQAIVSRSVCESSVRTCCWRCWCLLSIISSSSSLTTGGFALDRQDDRTSLHPKPSRRLQNFRSVVVGNFPPLRQRLEAALSAPRT